MKRISWMFVFGAIATMASSCGIITMRQAVLQPGIVGVLIDVRGSDAGLKNAWL